MNDMKNKTVLVTGSTDGIGRQTALELANMGATVIIHGRNRQKAEQARKEIEKSTGSSRLQSCFADFASLEEVSEMAGELHQRLEKIDVLINNAGVFMKEKALSKDGFEVTFAVNHLAHFLLTGMLIDLVGNSPYARIINVASQAHASQLDFENLQGEQFFDGYDAYSRSKLCNILFTYKLARELINTEITVNALHPGVIRTKLLQAGFGFGGSSLQSGAQTSIYLATSNEVHEITGKYYVHQRETASSRISYDLSVQDRLWKLSEEMTGFHYKFPE